MSNPSIVLLGDTGNNLVVVGDPVRADAFTGDAGGLHTIYIQLSNFTGRLYLEATLATEPTDEDWFTINLTGGTGYVEYPLIPNAPTGTSGDTGSDAYSFIGNLTYVRARIDKSYVVPVPTTDPEKAQLGSITKILLNH